jgi:hypothetical protein
MYLRGLEESIRSSTPDSFKNTLSGINMAGNIGWYMVPCSWCLEACQGRASAWARVTHYCELRCFALVRLLSNLALPPPPLLFALALFRQDKMHLLVQELDFCWPGGGDPPGEIAAVGPLLGSLSPVFEASSDERLQANSFSHRQCCKMSKASLGRSIA